MTIPRFLAYRIIIGKLTFAEVPNVLKPEVKMELEAVGCGYLAE